MRETTVRRFPALFALRSWRRAGLVGAAVVAMLLSVGGTEAASVIGSWSATGSMGAPRAWDAAALLADGRVLVGGGMSDNQYLSSAELFDQATGRWTATGGMTSVRAYHTSTTLSDGSVLVAGGTTDVQTSESAEVYDPVAGAWSATGSMGEARRFHTATLLPDARVLAAGGVLTLGRTNTALSSAELYDPNTGAWTATGNLGSARTRHTSTLLPNGKVLVVGGLTTGSSGTASTSAELYDPTTGTWTATGSMRTARAFHSAVRLRDGRILVAGGSSNSGTGALASAELYDPVTGRWTAARSMGTARASLAATIMGDGRVLVTGGLDRNASTLASAELYDPATGKWTSAGMMSTPRLQGTATLLPNGKTLVAGGQDSDDVVLGSLLSSAELFAP